MNIDNLTRPNIMTMADIEDRYGKFNLKLIDYIINDTAVFSGIDAAGMITVFAYCPEPEEIDLDPNGFKLEDLLQLNSDSMDIDIEHISLNGETIK